MKNLFAKKAAASLLSAAMLCTSVPVTFLNQTVTAADPAVIFSADFEDGENAFTRRGEDETLEITDSQAHGGTYSLCVSTRAKSWNGPQIALDDLINAGEEYVVTAYAKTTWYSTLTLSMQYDDSEGETHYGNILSANNDGSDWSAYENVKFSFPADATNMYLYFEAGDTGVDIYVDDFVITEAPVVEPEDIPSLKDVYNGYFNIGTAITPSNLSSKSFMALVEKHFNGCITVGNELKPDYVLNKNASLAMYEESGDDTNPQVTLASVRPLLDYCQKNNIPVRGHCLVWHSQTPDWFFKEGYSDDGDWVSKDKMIERMENYIKNVMEIIAEEYPDLNVYAWDVVNEAWTDDGKPRTAGSNNVTNGNSAWVQIFGDNSFIEYAFKFARKYAPEGCKLYYNDYNEYMGKMNAIYDMAMDLKEKGLIDGIGMQSHLDVNFPSASMYEKALEKYASTGLDIQVTELDVTTSDTSEAGLKKQAQYYSDIMDAIVKYKDSVSAVIFWGVTDDSSWRASQCPLLFDADYKAKPAYYSITDGITPVEPTSTATTQPKTTTAVSETTTSSVTAKTLGDANCDGSVDISDAVLIKCYLIDNNKYPMSEQGVANSDVQGSGNGVNAQDAVAVQKYVIGIIKNFD